MSTLVHLSDLHFDRVDPRVVEALASSVSEAKPDCIVLSGDLTQRAFRWQFRRGMQFLARFKAPVLIIAGNHDVPLHRPITRLFQPLARYKKRVTTEMMPVWDNGQVCVVGINTARGFSRRWKGFWKDGSIRRHQVKQAVDVFKNSLAPFRVVVTHHPLFVDRKEDEHDLVAGHRAAIGSFADFGVDLFLYGHLHVPHVKQVTVRSGDGPPRTVVGVMAGTGCSTRTRGVANSYNRIRFDEHGFFVDVLDFDGNAFIPREPVRLESSRRRTNPAHRST
ncbi:MAG: metallophosphoesterase [Tepidisphaeraceae bacterium]